MKLIITTIHMTLHLTRKLRNSQKLRNSHTNLLLHEVEQDKKQNALKK